MSQRNARRYNLHLAPSLYTMLYITIAQIAGEYLWAKRWELKLSDCDSIQIWWHDIARCTDSHGLHRCRVALGGLVALSGSHVAFISAFFCFLLVLEALEDGRVPKAASRLVHVWSPEARVTKDDRHVTAVQCQCCQCSESECVGLLSIRIIKYHQACYPEFFLFSFLDLLVWCSAISACLFFKKVFWICIIFGSQAPLWAWAGLVLAWLWPRESHTGTFWYFLVLLKLYDVTWNYYGSHKSYHDISCRFRGGSATMSL